MKKRLLILLILCPMYWTILFSMQQTQIQLRVDKNKLDVPYDFVTKQLGFLPKEMLDIETDLKTQEKYVDVSPLLSPEEFNLLQKMIPVILPKQNLSVKTLIDQRVFDQLINQSNWPSVYTLADKTNFALLQRYLSYYIAQLYVDKKIDLNTILNLAPAWHNSIAKYFFLITKKNLEKVNKNSYGFSIRELIDWGYDFNKHSGPKKGALNSLDLSKLRINNLNGFENLPGINNVKYLYLASNQLTHLPEKFLANASRLEYLYLEQNQLRSLPANFLANAPQLLFLDLSANQLTRLPADFLANAPALSNLQLNQNQLTHLPEKFLVKNPHLSSLNLGSNKLSSLPKEFLVTNAGLLYLTLPSNQLSQLPENFLSNNTQLANLHLEANELISLPNNFLSRVPNLTRVSLASNKLSSLPEKFLSTNTQLVGLDLSSNQLTSLPDNFLASNTVLRELNLASNRLNSLPADFLAKAPTLTNLYLHSNQLTSLPNNYLMSNTRLQKATIYGNRLNQKQFAALPNHAIKALEQEALISKAETIMDPKNQANPGAARIENWGPTNPPLEWLTIDQLKNMKVIVPIYDQEEMEKILALPLDQYIEALKELKPIATQETTLGELVKSTVGPEDID